MPKIIPQLQSTYDQLAYRPTQAAHSRAKRLNYLDLAQPIPVKSTNNSVKAAAAETIPKAEATPDQIAAVREYTCNDNELIDERAINPNLRKGRIPSELKKEIADLDEFLENRKRSGHIHRPVAMRGVDHSGVGYARALREGEIHRDKAFVSMSEGSSAQKSRLERAGGVAVYSFGDSGIPISDEAAKGAANPLAAYTCRKEKEVLYPRDTPFDVLFKHESGGKKPVTTIIQSETGKEMSTLEDRRRFVSIVDIAPAIFEEPCYEPISMQAEAVPQPRPDAESASIEPAPALDPPPAIGARSGDGHVVAPSKSELNTTAKAGIAAAVVGGAGLAAYLAYALGTEHPS